MRHWIEVEVKGVEGGVCGGRGCGVGDGVGAGTGRRPTPHEQLPGRKSNTIHKR